MPHRNPHCCREHDGGPGVAVMQDLAVAPCAPRLRIRHLQGRSGLMITTTHPRKSVVLVVEDEPIILMNAMEIVEDAGFEAIGAYNADEAVDILHCRDDISI